MADLPVRIINETSKDPPGILWEKVGGAVEEVLGRSVGPFTVVYVKSSRIQDLNRRLRGKNQATNILSFAESREIVVSSDTVKDEAREQKIEYKSWLARLLIHGILHLEGYNHNNSQETEKMEKLEDKILEILKF